MTVLLTPDEMAALERRAFAAGVEPFALMQRAGRAVADTALAMTSPEQRVLVVCGPGNNGGDGYVCAQALSEAGRAVACLALRDPAGLTGDAARAFALYRGPLLRQAPELTGFDLIVDALYGGGLSRDLAGEDAALVAAINASGVSVLAIDMPSGVDGASGRVRGCVVQATRTVTFETLRVGHVLFPGRALSGAVSVAPLGLERWQDEPTTWLNTPDLFRADWPLPDWRSHKYSRGHAAVVSGPLPMTGAARLAAMAAARIGAGAVTVLCPPDALATHAARLDAVMVHPFADRAELESVMARRKVGALAIGPGLGRSPLSREALRAAVASTLPLVLDADALTAFAGEPNRLASAVTRGARQNGASAPRLDPLSPPSPPPLQGLSTGCPRPVVITPHEGEIQALMAGDEGFANAPSKLEAARFAAKTLGVTVVYKGPDTVVAMPDGRASVANNAPFWMASAGSGDLLCGLVCGLLAQKMPVFSAASAAVWIHGDIGREAGLGFLADDGPSLLPIVLQRFFGLGPVR